MLVGPLSLAGEAISADWPMFGGTPQRSLQAEGEVPDQWSINTGLNIRWIAELGTQTYSSPIISRGKGGAQEKIKTMEDAGITIAKSPAEIGKTLLNKLSN